MIIFITGIDTGIGKTIATGMLARQYMAKGLSVITMKLAQTGCRRKSTDILTHRKLMGIPPTPEDRSGLTCPYIFPTPASPHLAARLAGKRIKTATLDRSVKLLASKYDIVLVEGVGGLMVPLNDKMTTLDFVAQRKWPVIIVTSPRLGSINHTLLSLEALHNRRIKLAAVIYNLHEKTRPEIVRDSRRIIRNATRRFGWHAPVIDLPAI